MASPREVSRSGKDRFGGDAWNGFVDLCAMEPSQNLTPVQRVAHLAFWYMSEVNNGGHFQYFCNKDHFNHREVVDALRKIGATTCASILSDAIVQFEASELDRPTSLEEYVETEVEANMSALDKRYYQNGDAEFQRCAEGYLGKNEREFVRWVE